MLPAGAGQGPEQGQQCPKLWKSGTERSGLLAKCPEPSERLKRALSQAWALARSYSKDLQPHTRLVVLRPLKGPSGPSVGSATLRVLPAASGRGSPSQPHSCPSCATLLSVPDGPAAPYLPSISFQDTAHVFAHTWLALSCLLAEQLPSLPGLQRCVCASWSSFSDLSRSGQLAPTAGKPLVSQNRGCAAPGAHQYLYVQLPLHRGAAQGRGDPTGWQANTLGLLMPHQSCSPDR